MTRTNEVSAEDKRKRLHERAGRAAEYALTDAVGRAGGELWGLSVKLNEGDTLLVLKARFPAGGMVSFVSGPDLASCLGRAVTMGNADELRWKADRFHE